MEAIEEFDYRFPELVLQVKLFALRDEGARLHQVAGALIDVLQEVLGCCLEQQNLVVVVPMVRKIAALFAHQLVVQRTVGDVRLVVVAARECRSVRRLLIRGLFIEQVGLGLEAGNLLSFLFVVNAALFELGDALLLELVLELLVEHIGRNLNSLARKVVLLVDPHVVYRVKRLAWC